MKGFPVCGAGGTYIVRGGVGRSGRCVPSSGPPHRQEHSRRRKLSGGALGESSSGSPTSSYAGACAVTWVMGLLASSIAAAAGEAADAISLTHTPGVHNISAWVQMRRPRPGPPSGRVSSALGGSRAAATAACCTRAAHSHLPTSPADRFGEGCARCQAGRRTRPFQVALVRAGSLRRASPDVWGGRLARMSDEGKPKASPSKRHTSSWLPGASTISRIASATGSLVTHAVGSVTRCVAGLQRAQAGQTGWKCRRLEDPSGP